MLLFHNVGKLIGVEEHQVFIDLVVVREQFVILFALVLFIHKIPETAYRLKVLRWLKFFLFVCAGGGIARVRERPDLGIMECSM